jgi:hypothetical protein
MNNLFRTIQRISNITNIKTSEHFVGRWSVPNRNDNRNDKNINLIIDRNNNDHCGTCHIEPLPKFNSELEDINNNMYYLPYIM